MLTNYEEKSRVHGRVQNVTGTSREDARQGEEVENEDTLNKHKEEYK